MNSPLEKLRRKIRKFSEKQPTRKNATEIHVVYADMLSGSRVPLAFTSHQNKHRGGATKEEAVLRYLNLELYHVDLKDD